MSPAQAILVGSLVIAASVVFVNTIRPAQAQLGGPYQLVHNGNPQANSSVFRIDTSSGAVSYCWVSAAGALSCQGQR
jgi:hypothetical protein